MELRGMFQALSPVKRGVKKSFTSVLELAQVKFRRHLAWALVRSKSYIRLKTGSKTGIKDNIEIRKLLKAVISNNEKLKPANYKKL
jgi:hypothetical protein